MKIYNKCIIINSQLHQRNKSSIKTRLYLCAQGKQFKEYCVSTEFLVFVFAMNLTFLVLALNTVSVFVRLTLKIG